MSFRKCLAVVLAVALVAPVASATSNYEYGADEYVAVSNGISPDGRLAITAHGDGEYGYDNFHLYLFDAIAGKKIGPLEEITETLDTGAEAFAVRWSKNSDEATIVYRVDRHAPLKAMTYHFTKGGAVPDTKKPLDLRNDELIRYWQKYGSGHRSTERTFGTPKQRP